MGVIRKGIMLSIIVAVLLANVIMNVAIVKAEGPIEENAACTKTWGNSTGRTGCNATAWGNSSTSTGCSVTFGNSTCIRMQCRYCCR